MTGSDWTSPLPLQCQPQWPCEATEARAPCGAPCAGRDEHGVGDVCVEYRDPFSSLNGLRSKEGLCSLETEDLASPGPPWGTDTFL